MQSKTNPSPDLIDVQIVDPNLEDDPVHLAGLLVVARPDQVEAVEASISQLPGVEVHLKDDKGQLVVTVEEPHGEKRLSATVACINETSGVISTSLVYAHQD